MSTKQIARFFVDNYQHFDHNRRDAIRIAARLNRLHSVDAIRNQLLNVTDGRRLFDASDYAAFRQRVVACDGVKELAAVLAKQIIRDSEDAAGWCGSYWADALSRDC